MTKHIQFSRCYVSSLDFLTSLLYHNLASLSSAFCKFPKFFFQVSACFPLSSYKYIITLVCQLVKSFFQKTLVD
nr:MAG TPA: hypothetical protein [Bacteriophage sp.]